MAHTASYNYSVHNNKKRFSLSSSDNHPYDFMGGMRELLVPYSEISQPFRFIVCLSAGIFFFIHHFTFKFNTVQCFSNFVDTRKRRDSLTVVEMPNFRQEQRPSTSSTASDSGPYFVNSSDMGCQALPPPTMVISSVTPPATSPTAPSSGRRDSTTQCGRVNRRDSRASPERPRLQRLQRQATAFDESCPPLGNRRESQPALSPTSGGPADGEDGERRARRDSLSPDSASRGRRDSRQSHLSPDRNRDRDGSPRRSKVRRQSSSAGKNPRSPESSSCCSSRYLRDINNYSCLFWQPKIKIFRANFLNLSIYYIRLDAD